MAKADSGQVRALAAAYAPGEAGGRALALHADPEWSGPDVLAGDGRRLRVVPCPSPLAVRAALVDHRDPGELLVLLTPCRGSELGLDVQARLCKGDVLPLDPFSSVLALFRATVLDPQLVHERALLDDLIALAPAGGWADRYGTGGVLDAGTAWRAWHRARLDLDGPPDDLAGLVGLGADPAVASAIAALPADRRDRLGARWAETLGDLAPLLVDLVAAGRGPDLAALGLVAEVLWAPTDRPELAATQTVARARLEPVLGRDRLTAMAAAGWGAAARQVLAADARRSSDAVDAAERILADAGAASLAVLSDALPRGFELRLAVLADALHAGDLDRAVAALRWVERHERAARRGHRVQAAAAAVRLLRRRATVTAAAEPTTFAQAAAAYALDGAFVDRAVRLLDDGDQVPELAAAYAALAADASAGRAGEVASFVARLAEWSQAEPVGDDRIVPLEHLLDRVVVPVAHDAPVLLVVCDGMALPVAHDLLDDLLAEGWAPAAPDERDGWPTGVALLPTVTEASRASLLTGTRTVGGQDVERAGFAAHPGLRAVSSPTRPPVLLHKAALVGPSGAALPDDVRRLVADPDQRVVGVVVNAVDDHLARGDQVRVGWDLNALRPLSWLLDAAREAGRVVVVTADHGHVLHRADAIVRQLPGGGERWRPAPPPAGDGEVELAGPRVLLGGGRVVVPADARLRYGGHKHGYHGGATPEEVLVPVAVLARGLPDGWHHHPLAAPAWWTGHEAVAAEAPAVPARSAPAPAPTTPAGQASLFEPAADEAPAGASWVDALLASPAFVDHRARVRLPRPMPDDRLRRYLDAIAANGDAIPLPALAARTGEPADTLRMALSLVQRLVNLDGAEILAVRADGTVSLNRELAGFQFGIRT